MVREKVMILTRKWSLMSFPMSNRLCSLILAVGPRRITLNFLPIRGKILLATRGSSRSRELCARRMFLGRVRIIMILQFYRPTHLWILNRLEGIKLLCFRLLIRRDGWAKARKTINTRILLIRLPFKMRGSKSDRYPRINLMRAIFRRVSSMVKANGRKMITIQGQFPPLIK